MNVNKSQITLEHRLLYLTVIMLLLAQYVVNSNPWDHVLRLAGLLMFLVVVLIALRKRVSRAS